MTNIIYQVHRETGLLVVENPSIENSFVHLTKDDIYDLEVSLESTTLNGQFLSKQFNVSYAGFKLEDTIHGTKIVLSEDNIRELADFIRDNEDIIADRDNFEYSKR